MSPNQVSEDVDSCRDVLALGEFVNKRFLTSNLITDQKCKGMKVRIAEVEVAHPEVEGQEDL